MYHRKNVRYRLKETKMGNLYQFFPLHKQQNESNNLYCHHMKWINCDTKWSNQDTKWINQDIVIEDQCQMYLPTTPNNCDIVINDQYQMC